MKYRIIFQKDNPNDSWDHIQVDEWKKESVVPRTGDSVFMKKGGWMTVSSVGFSSIESGKRLVFVTVK
jgi:hypothetical protein